MDKQSALVLLRAKGETYEEQGNLSSSSACAGADAMQWSSMATQPSTVVDSASRILRHFSRTLFSTRLENRFVNAGTASATSEIFTPFLLTKFVYSKQWF